MKKSTGKSNANIGKRVSGTISDRGYKLQGGYQPEIGTGNNPTNPKSPPKKG